MILLTLSVTAILEVWSMETVRKLWQQPGGEELYRQGWLSSIINPLLVGLPIYALSASFLCEDNGLGEEGELWLSNVKSVLVILVLHSCQYYAIHKAFHENPRLYQKFHRFHHKFHTHTPPSAANAVTLGEYLLAYIVPFLLPLLLVETTRRSLQIATSFISMCNLLVHTPPIESLIPFQAPTWWVSTTNHQDHHRKSMKTHYASPTLNIDTLVNWCLEKESNT